MKKLLSLPPNIVESFHEIEPRYQRDDWFCTSDPANSKLGSGGGTTWLLEQWEKSLDATTTSSTEKKIIIHAGGQSRRLPAYAAVGKVLTPMPVLRWALGNRIDQNLLSLQLPLFEQIMNVTPAHINTLIASGDVCLRTDIPIRSIPNADVVCFGLWAEPEQVSHHGVFLSHRSTPDSLDFMLQKPSIADLTHWSESHFYLMDIGLWLLSDKAVETLRKKSKNADGSLRYYDLYSHFGCALGENPSTPDNDINPLTVAIVPLEGGEFYHFGTTRELISSTLALQSKVTDQRQILHHKTKPNPALFVQNCHMEYKLTSANSNIWIENSHIAQNWALTQNNVITGVPLNDWTINIPKDACLDIIPIGKNGYAVRPYGYDDTMRGSTTSDTTTFLGQSIINWATEHGVIINNCDDIQSTPLFPIVHDLDSMGVVARWMISEPNLEQGKHIWLQATKLSADEISAKASLPRLYTQRSEFLKSNIPLLETNHEKSVFYQLDLDDLANKMCDWGLSAPTPLAETDSTITRMRNHMLRSRILKSDGVKDEQEAFNLMRQLILQSTNKSRCLPICSVYHDQIVWSRSPLRIDLAGGWTDTPPYSLIRGGNVVNMAVELNGQPPLQVFIKPSKQKSITIRSIDLGAEIKITTYEDLTSFTKVGDPFSLPKAAISLAGFAPYFCKQTFTSLEQQLDAFGCGFELTLLSAVPAGSGLGTSSILGATVLGALNDFCGLAWDTTEICSRTLALEQLLTTGGGWQDQYGGVLQGIKLLSTTPGISQQPITNWLPDEIFTNSQYTPCHLLYYTGITRTAKGILAEIVKRMFLNSSSSLRLLDEMNRHALEMSEAIQRLDFNRFGQLVQQTWHQNQNLDSGTNPTSVQNIINKVKDYTLGLKLPGAGGGGFLYMVAKDPDAATRIRHILKNDAPNSSARFVDMNISDTGLRISRS